MPLRPAALLVTLAGCSLFSSGPPDRFRCTGDPPSPLECMLAVPGGVLQQGAQASNPSGEGYDPAAGPEEGPVRSVTVAPFWIMLNEVLVSDYDRCISTGGPCTTEHVLSAGPLANAGKQHLREHPINGVTWQGAVTYCGWVGARLPTEAEWELAAAGVEGRRWPWGDEPGCGLADVSTRHFKLNLEGAPSCESTGTSILRDLRGDSPYGMKGMAGNVAEWVADDWAPYGGEAVPGLKVLRGGGWLEDDPMRLRTTARQPADPTQRLPDVGFRCAWSKGGQP